MESKHRGRAPNPYNSRLPWFSPHGTKGWLDAEEYSGATLALPGIYSDSDISACIELILDAFDVPILRRVLEKILVFTHGFHPVAVTNAIDALCNVPFPKVFRKAICVNGQENQVISYKRLAYPREEKALIHLCEYRGQLLTHSILRTAGERFARRALIASKSFTEISSVSNLGEEICTNSHTLALCAPSLKSKEQCEKPHKLDILATSKHSRIEYGISVKNQHEWITRGDAAIKDIYTKAKAHGRVPWLFVAWADDGARKRCEDEGIRLTVMHRQIVPKKTIDGHRMELKLKKLRPTVGPQDYLLFEDDFSRIHDERVATLIEELRHEPLTQPRNNLVESLTGTIQAEKVSDALERFSEETGNEKLPFTEYTATLRERTYEAFAD